MVLITAVNKKLQIYNIYCCEIECCVFADLLSLLLLIKLCKCVAVKMGLRREEGEGKEPACCYMTTSLDFISGYFLIPVNFVVSKFCFSVDKQVNRHISRKYLIYRSEMAEIWKQRISISR